MATPVPLRSGQGSQRRRTDRIRAVLSLLSWPVLLTAALAATAYGIWGAVWPLPGPVLALGVGVAFMAMLVVANVILDAGSKPAVRPADRSAHIHLQFPGRRQRRPAPEANGEDSKLDDRILTIRRAEVRQIVREEIAAVEWNGQSNMKGGREAG